MSWLSIDLVAEKYRARGHGVRVINSERCEVIDREAGNIYRVTRCGRAVVGRELAEEIRNAILDPHSVGAEKRRPLAVGERGISLDRSGHETRDNVQEALRFGKEL